MDQSHVAAISCIASMAAAQYQQLLTFILAQESEESDEFLLQIELLLLTFIAELSFRREACIFPLHFIMNSFLSSLFFKPISRTFTNSPFWTAKFECSNADSFADTFRMPKPV